MIPDRVPPGVVLPLDDQQIADLHRLCTGLPGGDVAAVRRRRPQPGDLPVGATLRDQYDRLRRLRQSMADLEQDGVDLAALDGLDQAALDRMAVLASQAAARLGRLAQPWLDGVRAAVRSSPPLYAYWAEQADQLAARTAALVDLQRRTVGRDVHVPAGDYRVQLDLLDDLAARFAAGKVLPRLGARDLRAFHDQVRIDGLSLRNAADIDVVRAHLALTVQTRGLQTHLTQLAAQAGLPLPAPDAGFLTGVTLLVQHLQDALRWEAHDGPQVRSALRAAVPGVPDVLDVAAVQHVVRLLERASVRRQERHLSAELNQWAAYLDTQRRSDVDRPPGPDRRPDSYRLDTGGRIDDGDRLGAQDAGSASPLWGQLLGAFTAERWDRWDTALAEAARLQALAPEVARRDALLGRLRPVAPQWAARLESGLEAGPQARQEAGRDAGAGAGREAERDGAAAAVRLPPGRWREAWLWAQAETWLQALHARGDLEGLQRRHEAVRVELERLVIDLATRGAALGLKRNLKDEQRRALSAWINAVRRVGRNTGRHAPHWAAEARQELPVAMGAVPIWIMPIHRVIENFDPRRSELFDVVIVDESSQCDLLSVGVLALGRKCVVVGDDKQTTPAGIGVPHEDVFALQDIYLQDVPQKALLTIDESLYGLAERAFPNVVMLREHFRCVSEIIQFSNRYYDHRILPLRERTRDGIGEVLRVVAVPDGACTGTSSTRLNRPEAQALVDQVVACAEDPAYDGATFGVVVLQSGQQSKVIEGLLAQRLGYEEFQRRQLRVGTASAFQGDERDIVFISVVADDNGYAAVRLGDKQRVNVAASRARDQLWVFHTVDPATLHAEDQRRALIEYARDAAARREEATDLLQRCESEFERDVLTQLLQRGYEVHVQHRVGAYRIDMFVQGERGERDRLAVECDGDRFHGPEQWDADLRRQRVLERTGWKFWRILASTYYRSPQDAMQALCARLDRLGIRPMPVRESTETPTGESMGESMGESVGESMGDARSAAPQHPVSLAPDCRAPEPSAGHPAPLPDGTALPDGAARTQDSVQPGMPALPVQESLFPSEETLW